ncbi:MAG TPA: tol-pal system protein YbgF [Candidatus Saccharimonadales bacterium]|nr:tol-pal system protein YbgF [Candidatus Saccharimonadales bacterium]
MKRKDTLRVTKGAALLSAALAMAAIGCAPSGYYRSTSSSLDSLLTLQAQQQRRIAALEREIASTREQVQASRASSDTRLSELTGRMDMLQGQLERSGAQFKDLSLKVENVKSRISTADTARAYGGRPPDSTGGMDPEEAWKAASSDYANGRYALAKQAYTSYVRRFPDTVVSDDAQFRVGECAFLTGDFPGAIEAYKAVVERYPDGDKVAGALYKTGVAYARLNNMDEARKYYRSVITRFPKSSEAAAAREAMAPKRRTG